MLVKRIFREIDFLFVDCLDLIVGKWFDGEFVFVIVKEDFVFNVYFIKIKRKDIKFGFLKMSFIKQGGEYEGSYIFYIYVI